MFTLSAAIHVDFFLHFLHHGSILISETFSSASRSLVTMLDQVGS